MIKQAVSFDPKSEPAQPLMVRCPKCGARAGHSCVKVLPHESLWDLYDAELRSPAIKTIHRERTARAKSFHQRGIKWPCERCDGWRYPIDSGDEMTSSSEGCCNGCGLWVGAPDNSITLDELYESLLHNNPEAAKLLDEYELYDNPKAARTNMEMMEREDNEPMFLSRKRTKPIEYNPARRERLREEESLCECGFNNHKWSKIVEKKYQDRSVPCSRCGAACPYGS